VRRLLGPLDPLVNRDQDLRRWRQTFEDSVPIADLRPRRAGTVVGVVKRIRLEPGKLFEVTVEDGTGELVASWTGRSSLRGVGLSSALRLTGTVAEDPEGRRKMRTPAWEPVSEPYA
jgi:hypothetical protein